MGKSNPNYVSLKKIHETCANFNKLKEVCREANVKECVATISRHSCKM